MLRLLLCLLLLACSLSLRAQEPTYTLTIANGKKLHLRLQSETGANGGRVLRLWNLPQGVRRSDLLLDQTLHLNAGGEFEETRLRFGNWEGDEFSVVARRRGGGELEAFLPEETKTLRYGAPLLTPFTVGLFIGRLYDFKKGGPQTFGLWMDRGSFPIQIVTVTLTADGSETLTLPSGPVKARRLRYAVDVPALPEEKRSGVFHVGPKGEMLTGFFDFPHKAAEPLVVEGGGATLRLPFDTSHIKGNVTAELVGTRRGGGGYDMTVAVNDRKMALFRSDKDYKPTYIEWEWRGRPYKATITPGAAQVVISGKRPQVQPLPSKQAWFLPYLFWTDLWEGAGKPFAEMRVGEKRDADYFPLWSNYDAEASGEPLGIPAQVERLADAAVTLGDGKSQTLRRYRFTGKPVYDVYTDGGRLVAFFGSDKTSAVRTGWEAWAKAQTFPDAAPQAK